MKLRKKETLDFCAYICDLYDARLVVREPLKNTDADAEINFDTKVITLWGTNKPCAKILSDVFHELGHLYCREAQILADYNSTKHMHKSYYDETALLAEQIADIVGRHLMFLFLPDVTYEAWYVENPVAASAFIEKEFEL